MNNPSGPASDTARTRSSKIEARRAKTRERLRQIAGRLFAEHGIEHVCVEDILKEADISRRTFYSYFANKKELAAAIVETALNAGTDILRAAAKRNPPQPLLEIIQCYQSLWQTHGYALAIISSLDMEIVQYIEASHRNYGLALKAILKQAQKAGELRNDDSVLTFRIFAKTAVPLLKLYADHPDGNRLYRDSMLGLLSKNSTAQRP